jgi:hypothetical protein
VFPRETGGDDATAPLVKTGWCRMPAPSYMGLDALISSRDDEVSGWGSFAKAGSGKGD